MRTASTIAGLGAGTRDGETAVLRYGSTATRLRWHTSPAVWLSDPHVAVEYRDLDRMDGPTTPDHAWKYLALPVTGHAGAFSWMPRAVLDAQAAYSAGLVLQEDVQGIYWCWNPATVFQIAVVWYAFDHDGFIDPAITPDDTSPGRNVGVLLSAWPTIRGMVGTGWQDSPIDTPTAGALAPHLYTRFLSGTQDPGHFPEEIVARWRWKGAP